MTNFAWPKGKQCAVGLCYDGARPCHIELAAAHLEQTSLRGTFFLEPVRALDHLEEWQYVQNLGHELGNGALLDSADERGNLDLWPLSAVLGEVQSVDAFLEGIFDCAENAAVALPRGESLCAGAVSFEEALVRDDRILRTGAEGLNSRQDAQIGKLKSFWVEAFSLTDFQRVVESAREQQKMALFTFDEIGEGTGVDARLHLDLCEWLASQSDILVVPISELLVLQIPIS